MVAMKKMVVMSLLTLSMVAGSFSYVCAASLNHTSEIAVQSAADNTDTPQIENQTTNADEKANEMMKSIENTFASSKRFLQRPYIVRFIIFNRLFVPSTKPLL